MPQRIAALISCLCLALSAGAASAAEPRLADYQAAPYWIAPRSVPMVLLVLSKDQKMFRHAYSPGDHDGDGDLDIGFNPETTYLGYHDSDSCYKYHRTGSGEGYFQRSGPAKEDPGDAPPRVLDEHIRKSAPKNAHGVCNAGDGEWHGNWLNFMMTSRIDAIKKVLYGGTRQIDKATDRPGTEDDGTILEHSYIPRNALVWGYDVMADDMWSKKTAHLPYYNADYYLGAGKPTSGNMHFFARFTDGISNDSLTKPPLMQMIVNLDANQKNADGTDYRVWNWTVLGDSALIPPNAAARDKGAEEDDRYNQMRVCDTYTGTDKGSTIGCGNPHWVNAFVARVRVCQKLAGEEAPPSGEGCTLYTTNYKPTGLLQKYGAKDDMYFGLMTGTADGVTKQRGGVMRHHIDSIKNAIDPVSGVLRVSGATTAAAHRADTQKSNLIRTIDKLTVTSWIKYNGNRGAFLSANPNGRGTATAVDSDKSLEWTAFGNPIGEMLYEGVRYFGALANYPGLQRATGEFQPTGERKDHIYPASRPLPRLGEDGGTWMSRRPTELAGVACSKPVILMLSDIDNTFDGDNFGDITDPPALPELAGDRLFGGGFSLSKMEDYLASITKNEGYGGGTKYYYAKKAGSGGVGVCEPRELNSLADVEGLCPNEPSLRGSYSMAAVAHYAHTHDFSSGENTAPIDVYGVAVTPALPALDFTVPAGEGQDAGKITIIPSAVMDRDRNNMLSFIGYAVENWDTDDKGTPYKVRINVNYPDESEVYIGWSDYEQDSTSIYEVSLLTDDSTPEAGPGCGQYCRETKPVIIHNGPADMRGYDPPDDENCNPPEPKKPNDPLTGCNTPTANAGKYYRFAREPNGGDMEIPRSAIKGLAVTSMILKTSTSAEIALGYSIVGSAGDYDGTYIEVGANRHNSDDYPPPISQWEMDGSPRDKHTNVADCTATTNPPCARNTPANRPDLHGWDRGMVERYNSLFTPMGCEKPAAQANRGTNKSWCNTSDTGQQTVARKRMRILQTRAFTFASATDRPDAAYLPSPLELAAKYGGFADPDGDGLPDNKDTSTWAALEYDKDGRAFYGQKPKNYFYVANLASLSDELGQAFEAIANSVTTGTVNSASINEVMGGGITVKTQYHSTYTDSRDVMVKWLGNVYSLFVDSWGNQREDSDAPDPEEGRVLDIKKDKIILTKSDPVSGLPVFERYPDPYGNNAPPENLENPNDLERLGGVEDIEAVWNATRWLVGLNNVTTPRAYKTAAAGRRVYSYFPKTGGTMEQPSDGAGFAAPVQLNDSYVFEPSDGKIRNAGLRALLRCASGNDAARSACAKNLIEYTLGVDKPDLNFRGRTVVMPWKKNNGTPWFDSPRVWRMGDVMNSNPIIVAEASSNYHTRYGDKSYLKYADRITGRRNMIYFGSNDGILHAVNAGFYGSLKLGQAAYFVDPVICDRDNWAAIPTKPKVCDRMANPPAHELGAEVWGFIPTSILPHLKWATEKDFNHTYMVDLTPTLADVKIGDPNDEWGGWRTVLIGGLRLGGRGINIGTETAPEYVHSEYFALDITDPEEEPKLLWRYSSPELGQSVSEPVVARSGGNWYVVLPSGPTMHGEGDDERTVYDGRSNQRARVIVLDAKTGRRQGQGNPDLVADEENSFFNNASLLLPLPFNVDNSDRTKVDWSHHVAYLGLSARQSARNTGAVYRLQMVDAAGKPLKPSEWKLTTMFNPERPVTGAVNATYDDLGHLWILFGTGRMWSQVDVKPCENMPAGCAEAATQYFYGVKEELVEGNPALKGLLTFRENLQNDDILDVSRISVYTSGKICNLGSNPDKKACSAGEISSSSYAALAAGLKSDSYRGYKRALNIRETIGEAYETSTFELINTRPEIDGVENVGSNVVVTVYVPSGDACDPAGESFLLVLDSYTGLPAPYMKGYDLIQKETGIGDPDNAGSDLTLMTSVLKSGQGMASSPYVQHIGSLTIYGNTSANTTENQVKLGGGGDGPGGPGNGTGTMSWREAVDTALPIEHEDLFKDLLVAGPGSEE